MPGTKRPAAAISGERIAHTMLAKAGEGLRAARSRRGLTQAGLAERVGVSRASLAAMEAGQGGTTPLAKWFGLAKALDLYLKFEFGRDPQAELLDAGHLALQELVIRLATAAGWEVHFEAESRAWGIGRSIDVRLIDRKARRIVIVECWNTFGNLGEAARSSNAKVRQEHERAVAIAGEGDPFEVGMVWVVRDSKANRELIGEYPHIFEARLPGSSAAWVATVTAGAEPPAQPGLIWSDTRATRLFAWRRSRRAR